jgi:hypothetical protein
MKSTLTPFNGSGPQDYSPLEQMRLQRFDGKQWVLFGDIITP